MLSPNCIQFSGLRALHCCTIFYRNYHEYIVEKQGKTLLPQYLGLYRLTVEGSEVIW